MCELRAGGAGADSLEEAEDWAPSVQQKRMDWLKGKSSPETIDCPMKYGMFLSFFPETNQLKQKKWGCYTAVTLTIPKQF